MKYSDRREAAKGKLSKQVIDCGETDITLFNDIRSRSVTLSKDAAEMAKIYTAYSELQQDVYDALFKYEPEMKPEHLVDYSYIANRMIMEKMMEMPRYREMRTATMLEPINAAVGTQAISEELKEIVKEFKKELDDLKKSAEGAKGGGEGEGEESDEKSDEKGNAKSKKKMTAEEAMREYEKNIRKVQEILDRKQTETALTAMVINGNKKIKEVSDFIQAWGLEGSATFSKMPLQDQLAYVTKLQDNPILRKIAELGRRLTFIATNMQQEQVKHGVNAIVDIELGDDLSKILPEELIDFSMPETRMQFLSRWVDGRCMQLKQHSKQKKQRGPLVIAVDQSGSMSGEPFVFATSVSMALLQIAYTQKRDVVLIPFSSGTPWDKLKRFEFPKNKPHDPETLIEACLYFEGKNFAY